MLRCSEAVEPESMKFVGERWSARLVWIFLTISALGVLGCENGKVVGVSDTNQGDSDTDSDTGTDSVFPSIES